MRRVVLGRRSRSRPERAERADAPGSSQPGAPVMTLQGVRAGYGRIEVLHGIDLCVGAGEVLALLGPNGAGKSTLLKVAGGRLPPTSGSASVMGRPLSGKGPSAVGLGVCSIPEGRGVFPNLTVEENLLMWTYQPGVSRRDIEEAAYGRFSRLAERRHQLAGTLSGGEQQMLAFARALAGDPKVLLLDEISMGLAPLVVADLYSLVGELASQGVAVILAEQFVRTAMDVATRAAILVQGRIARIGSPEDVADAALGAYLATSAD